MLYGKLTPRQKLTKSRVNLNDTHPFFGHLTMRLVFEEKPECSSIGVFPDGKCEYNPEFIDKLSQDKVDGVLCHEVMHCALEHFVRIGAKEHPLWNVSTDAVINALLLLDNMHLPEGGILPHNDTLKLYGVEIKDVHKKSAEEIYDKLYDAYKKNKDDTPDGFDEHNYGAGKDDKNSNGGSGQQIDVDWEKELVEASTFAKMQGNLPAGIKRLVDGLLGNKIDWRGMLYKYIQNVLPYDYTWQRPNKKSYATGIYMPETLKEKIDVIIDIDTSMSISQKELQIFSSEVLGIVNSFENIELTILYNDTEVYGPHRLQNPTADDIERLKPEGFGGTNHIPVFEWIDKNNSNAKLLICFTDGYTSFPKDVNIDTLWVLSGNHCDKKNIPFGNVIVMPRE